MGGTFNRNLRKEMRDRVPWDLDSETGRIVMGYPCNRRYVVLLKF